jgi:hypothetical protein
LFDLGLAEEAAGQPQKAMATYERYRQLAPFALGRGELIGFALARMALLQEKGGDRTAAAGTRKILQTLWRGADGPLLALRQPPAAIRL